MAQISRLQQNFNGINRKKIDINGSIFAEILMNQLITNKTFYLNLDNKSKYYKWLIYLKLGQLFINKNKDKIIEDIVTNIKKEIFNDINKVINLLITSKNLNKGVENLFGITKLTELEECKKLKELVEFNNIEELLKSENKLTIITNIISTIKLESLGSDILNNLNNNIKNNDINEIIEYIIDNCNGIKEFIKISSCIEIIEILKQMKDDIEFISNKKKELETMKSQLKTMEDELKTMKDELKTMEEKLKTITKQNNINTKSKLIEAQKKNISTKSDIIKKKKKLLYI